MYAAVFPWDTRCGGESMNNNDDVKLRISPVNRICSKYNLQSLATFPIAAPGEMGLHVIDDCTEEHIM